MPVSIEKHDRHSENDMIDLFQGSVTYHPNSARRTSLSIAFQQKRYVHGAWAMTPNLSFSAILPLGSEIFVEIEKGNESRLRALLHEGKASLSDRDVWGQPLLNVSTILCSEILVVDYLQKKYAIFSLKPHICKFLLDHGADADVPANTMFHQM